MTTQAHVSKSLIWPTTLAGVLGAVILAFAVLAGPTDAASGSVDLPAPQQVG